MEPERIFPGEYVPNAEGVPYHQKWERSNPGEAQRWQSFRNAVLAYKKGASSVPVPAMSTKYGRALVAAGRLHMSVLDLGTVWPTPPPPSGSLPLQPPGGYSGPLTITTGGTYSGIAHEATGAGNAITIATSQPVVIEDSWIRNLSTGDLIKGENFQIRNLTLRGCRLYGGTGRVYDAEGVERMLVENCTIDKTTGMNHAPTGGAVPPVSIVCTKNRARNIQGVSGYLSAFFKVREIQTGTVEVSWNEVVNEYNLSHPEDIISLFKSANCDVHDNYIEHNSTPGNAYNTSSQGTITCDYPDGTGPVCHDIHIHDNQMVDTVNAVLIPSQSFNILVERNRLIQDGKLPDGTQMGNGYSGWAILGPVTNCHMHENVTGYVNRDGVRYDWHDVLAAPEGRAAEIAQNTTLADPITRQMELNEWTSWQAKLAANNITVGA